MVICPLTSDECSKKIIPSSKTAFIISPSTTNQPTKMPEVIMAIYRELKKAGFKPIEGASLVDYGDFVCSICKSILSCPFGIAFAGKGVPDKTLCNIFWEIGLMQGFGKVVLLVADEALNLPSDFNRTFIILYNQINYVEKFRKSIQKLKDLPRYYMKVLAPIALDALDYEKAQKYYQDAYLFSANRRCLSELEKIKKSISGGKKSKQLDGMSARVANQIDAFIKGASI